jgi:hypothetical protein
MKKISIQIPILAIVGIAIAGGAFYGGMLFGKSTVGKGGASIMDGRPQGQNGTMRQKIGSSGGIVMGEVISKTGTGFTIKLRDGGSKIVLTASSTTIGKMTEGTVDDLSEGMNIVVTGTTNSDGSVTASTVQIRSSGEGATMPGLGAPPEGEMPSEPVVGEKEREVR